MCFITCSLSPFKAQSEIPINNCSLGKLDWISMNCLVLLEFNTNQNLMKCILFVVEVRLLPLDVLIDIPLGIPSISDSQILSLGLKFRQAKSALDLVTTVKSARGSSSTDSMQANPFNTNPVDSKWPNVPWLDFTKPEGLLMESWIHNIAFQTKSNIIWVRTKPGDVQKGQQKCTNILDLKNDGYNHYYQTLNYSCIR